MAEGFASGLTGGFAIANLGNYNNKIDKKPVQQPKANTDGTHNHLGDQANDMPDGYTGSDTSDLA